MGCLSKIKHEVSHCTTENGLQIFYDDARGKYTGYCFSCASKGLEAYVQDPYGESDKPTEPPKKKTKEEVQAEIDEVRALNNPDFIHRGIDPKYFKQSGVRMAFSEFDGKTPNSFNFPHTLKGKLVGYMTIVLNKKIIWSVGDIKGSDLFNWEVAKKKGVKRLYVTEGHWDCLALEMMLESQSGGKYKYAVVSIPNGVQSAAPTLGRMRKEIEELFEEVVLVFDNDEAGGKAVREVQKVLPDILEAPHLGGIKDANEALQKGKQKEFVDFVMWKARKPPIEGVVTVSQIMSRGIKEPEIGLSYPWSTISEVMYGQRGGEATAIAGGVGCGKTVILHECAAHNIKVHNTPVAVFLLEEDNHKTLWNVAGKIDSLKYNVKEVFEANKERYYETIKSLEDKLYIWNSQGNSGDRFNLPEMLAAIRFNHAEYGCQFADIDNLTKVVSMMSTTEANEFINKWSSEIANLASELGIHIRVYSHLNPPTVGKSHEEGGAVIASQLTGSRGVMRSFANIIGFERNKMAEEESRKANSFLSILKNRDYGNEQKVKTQYSKQGRLLEYNWEGNSL